MSHARRDPLVKAGDPALVDVLFRRDFHRLDRLPGRLLDPPQHVSPAGVQEEDGVAVAARSARPPDPVDVAFGVERKVVVDDVADALHVQAARGHVRGDDHVELARAQVLDDALARALRNVTAQGRGPVPLARKIFGERLGRALGVHEDKNAIDRFGFENAGENLPLLMRTHNHESLPHRIGGGGSLLDRDLGGVPQVPLGDSPDRFGNGGREERDLPLGRAPG